MYKLTSFYSLVFIAYVYILSSAAWADSAETKFDDRFYVSKICTSYITRNDAEYCDDGYILKSETSTDGQTEETVLMDGIGGYGWNHISIGKIDADIYHVYIGCGSPCGVNMLFGRGSKEQDFGLYFDLDTKSRCTVEYDDSKKLWVVRRFFSDSEIILPSTYGISESAVQPKFSVEFDKKGNLIITDLMNNHDIKHLPNPCNND